MGDGTITTYGGMSIAQIEAYATAMLKVAEGDRGALQRHERIAVVTAAMGVCGPPVDKAS